MKIYEMTNFRTGEIFQAPLKTLYNLGRSIWREAVRYNKTCWLDLHPLKTDLYPCKCISFFVNIPETDQHKISHFFRG